MKEKAPLSKEEEKAQSTVMNVLKHSWNKYEV